MKLTLDLLSARRMTAEGYLVVPARVARVGIQEYLAGEIGLEGDPDRLVLVYRSEAEVFNPAAMASFDGMPITDDHPGESVTAENWGQYAVGFVRNPRREGDYLVCDLYITRRSAIDKIKAGKAELSAGYSAAYIDEPGVTPDGKPFDAQQADIRGNHVAIVDAGRCGPACRVSDSKPQPRTGEPPMAKRRITVDGINLELEETEASAVESIASKLQAANAQVGQLESDLETATAPTDVDGTQMTPQQMAAEITKLRAELAKANATDEDPAMRDAAIAAAAKVIGDAKRLLPAVVTDGKPLAAIRREVVVGAYGTQKPMLDALLGGKAPADADQAHIDTAFNVLAAAAPASAAHTDDAGDAVARALASQQHATADAEDPRAAYANRLTTAYKGK
ncbi:hypothetical protein SAMN02800692_2000 [Luteibacter sp. UNC138MFCol5.1]|uniref:DUF2213 domain-containing protein n=1 Tax=Luteibacter sp. UNC138MFCol5.1 TaxID=1502774 RepID=UPI0008B2A8C8|nr:DUF2213 domain-containing protein [Luteibacter sp. UNC138MFCol5.1]SEO76464.1 hypothetical protein SAMN02800692_2000 [Luteibacter sp. UNC138MFCol5.1]